MIEKLNINKCTFELRDSPTPNYKDNVSKPEKKMSLVRTLESRMSSLKRLVFIWRFWPNVLSKYEVEWISERKNRAGLNLQWTATAITAITEWT